MTEHIVIRTVARVLIPFIQIFGLYVIAHGDISPGGGFQGGVILGSSIIFYVITFGMREGRKKIPEKVGDLLNSTGIMIYAGIGVLCLIAGGAYLQYSALPLGDAQHASHLGIYGIEIGVGITVSGVMMTIFFETAKHGDDRDD